MLVLVGIALLALAACSVNAQDETPPPVFAKIGFEKALEANRTDHRILVVKATATWCAPCKQMDRTTWRDEKVVKWFDANGVAIHFDVDQEAALTKKLDIQAMPTMIAFQQGAEFDRVVGYQSPTEFVEWLEGVKAGVKSIEVVRKRARETSGSEEKIEARQQLAKKLLQGGEYEQATVEYSWLWKNTAGTSYSGVRVSFLASEMERLASKYPPAKELFASWRDELTKALQGEQVDGENFEDWIVLNGVLRDDARTLECFDQRKSDRRWIPLLRRESYLLDRLLVDAKRWADLAILYPDPVSSLQRAHELLEMSRKFRKGNPLPFTPPGLEEMEDDQLRESAGTYYAAMLASGDSERAGAVVAKALELDDSAKMRMALVQRALFAELPREEQRALLDGAEKQGADPKALARLRKQFAEKLGSRSPR